MSYKNDPDYHDIRARVLLEAARNLTRAFRGWEPEQQPGIIEAAAELRRMATNARRTHKKILTQRENAARASDAKWKAFGY